MKTEKQIEEMARSKAKAYADVGINNFPTLNPDGFKNDSLHFKQGLVLGYTQAQKDLLAEASEGLNEFLKKHEVRTGIDTCYTDCWQSSRLPLMKKIESHESQMEGLESERCHSMGVIEKLQKENKELKSVLKVNQVYSGIQAGKNFSKEFVKLQKENEELREALDTLFDMTDRILALVKKYEDVTNIEGSYKNLRIQLNLDESDKGAV